MGFSNKLTVQLVNKLVVFFKRWSLFRGFHYKYRWKFNETIQPVNIPFNSTIPFRHSSPPFHSTESRCLTIHLQGPVAKAGIWIQWNGMVVEWTEMVEWNVDNLDGLNEFSPPYDDRL